VPTSVIYISLLKRLTSGYDVIEHGVILAEYDEVRHCTTATTVLLAIFLAIQIMPRNLSDIVDCVMQVCFSVCFIISTELNHRNKLC